MVGTKTEHENPSVFQNTFLDFLHFPPLATLSSFSGSKKLQGAFGVDVMNVSICWFRCLFVFSSDDFTAIFLVVVMPLSALIFCSMSPDHKTQRRCIGALHIKKTIPAVSAPRTFKPPPSSSRSFLRSPPIFRLPCRPRSHLFPRLAVVSLHPRGQYGTASAECVRCAAL